jgi:ABC-type branched-subunit amino acid transport system substrate-binding protein
MSRLLKNIVVMLGLSFFLAQLSLGQSKPEIKVGVLLSFSGGLEQWCGYIRQGIELAASEEAAVKINVLFEDDRSVDRKASLTAAQKLVHVDKVNLFTTWTTSLVPVLSPLASTTRTPLLVGAYDTNVAKGGPYVFGCLVNYDILPREIARFLVVKKGARTIGLILAEDPWSQSYEATFSEEVKNLGASLKLATTVLASETDLRALVLRLKREKVEAVLAPLYGSALYSFLKTVRELQYSGLIHVADGMFEEDLKIAGQSAEGVLASQFWLESKELALLVKKRYGDNAQALQLGLVASGYDWVKHLQGIGAKLVGEGKPISRETLRQELTTFKSNGYLGEQMFGAPPKTGGEVVVVVKNGRYVLAQ